MARFTKAQNVAAAAKAKGDARNVIVARSRGHLSDARDKLATLAKKTDARDKITKIRNLKQGKLDVKKTSKGGITIVTTTRGKLQLTTKKKEVVQTRKAKAGQLRVAGAPGKQALRAAVAVAAASTRAPAGGTVSRRGTLTKRVAAWGGIAISTKKKGTMIRPAAAPVGGVRAGRVTKPTRTARPGGRATPAASALVPAKKLTRTIAGHMSESARLDEELMSTHVDPVILKRTIRQTSREGNRDRSPGRRYVPTASIRRSRSRSPMDYHDRRGDYGRRPSGSAMASASRRYNDYDDPRAANEREDDEYRRRIAKNSDYPDPPPRTMADRLDGGAQQSSSYVSPLQGAKIVVSNLQDSVSQDDIVELFGDIGPLKRTKVVETGSFEVVFVNRADALKAVEIYHNRQLDGRAMKCQVVGTGGASASSSSFPKSSRSSDPSSSSSSLHPEMGAIHRALFSERSSGGGGSRGSRAEARPSKPLFTVTMAKKDRR